MVASMDTILTVRKYDDRIVIQCGGVIWLCKILHEGHVQTDAETAEVELLAKKHD
jgi:hypothetical protein